MAQSLNTPGIELEDAVDVFDRGMNQGIAPILLPKNQLGLLRNGTLRGFYPTPRPPYYDITLNYNGNGSLRDAVETGVLQGHCYYKPDVGAESLLASISGKLFQFVIVDKVATVFDVTGGNPQSADAPQCWLWQSEKWVIWNDGINLPVFFDGLTTRRSTGSAITTLATSTSAITLAAPGGVTALTLVAPGYTGPFNVPIRMTAPTSQVAVVQAITAAAIINSYQLTVRTLHKVGATDGAGAVVTTKPGTVGWTTAAISTFIVPFNQTTDKVISVTDTTNLLPISPGTTIKFGSVNAEYRAINSSTSLTARFRGTSPEGSTFTIANDALVTIPSNTQPNVTIGTLSQTFTIPAVGSTGTMTLSGVYSGPANIVVYIGTTDQFLIVGSTSGTTGTSLNVLTISGAISTAAGTTTTLSSVPELPAGRMGVYGLGRNWMALTDGRSYIAGDIVGNSDSGTPGYNFTDSVLRITENTFLAGGGAFVVPGAVGDIRAMRFLSELDKSLGQGPLQILTPLMAFSNNAPVDRSLWQGVTNPIQTQSLIGFGALGQDASLVHNGDLFFRSPDGWRSLILARRDFNSWGNTSLSNEVRDIVAADDQTLLPFASAIEFDNRTIFTATPTQVASGVQFSQLIAINLDPLSSMGTKSPSIYDGVWDGLNVLKLVTGQFNQQQRAFAFVVTSAGRIGLTELLSTASGVHFDNGNITTGKITMTMELPVMFRSQKDPHRLLGANDGEMYVDSIDQSVACEVFFRPDYSPNYFSWNGPFTIPATSSYNPAIGFGDCPTLNYAQTGRTANEGYYFQLKIVTTGYLRILGARVRATTIPMRKPTPMIRRT